MDYVDERIYDCRIRKHIYRDIDALIPCTFFENQYAHNSSHGTDNEMCQSTWACAADRAETFFKISLNGLII